MKTYARLLVVSATILPAGCATSARSGATAPADRRPIARAERPLSSRDYWFLRQIDDQIDRTLEGSLPATGRRS